MYTITYNLRHSDMTSEAFYNDLKAYGKEVFKELDELLYDPILAYFRFRIHEGLKKVYSYEEVYLELLTLGVLWTVYSGDALATKENTNELLQKLADIRENNKHLKPIADAFRGFCLTYMMSPDLYDHMGIATPTRANLNRLLDWLEATGEFKYEVSRLRHWERYLETMTEAKARELLETIISTGLWFEKDSIESIGQYTENVDRYLNEMRPKRYWKEDVIFCGRRRVEYHLNMVGAEWLNLGYRNEFLEKNNRIVLVPTCMKLLAEGDCQAEAFGELYKCVQCTEACQVNAVSQLKDEYGFKLYMVPHNSSLKNSPLEAPLDDVGIVGVSCVLNLISGGWMLNEMNIPAQCVLLDYCGCKGHWHQEGIPTGLNLQAFKALFDN